MKFRYLSICLAVTLASSVPLFANGKADEEVVVQKNEKKSEAASKNEKKQNSDETNETIQNVGKQVGEAGRTIGNAAKTVGSEIGEAAKAFKKGVKEGFSSEKSE